MFLKQNQVEAEEIRRKVIELRTKIEYLEKNLDLFKSNDGT